jgi:7-cyano-7-deazaguanine reductase
MELTHLGRESGLPASPGEARLDYPDNPRIGRPYLVRFTAPEFTSLCPVTGQPDFAHLVIDYAPAATIVESKSLKLFLGAFRNHCGFHEDVTVGIGERLVAEMAPLWLRIGGYWYPRGGMPIDVFWQSGERLPGLWVPGPRPSPLSRPGLRAHEISACSGTAPVGGWIGGAWASAGLDVTQIGREGTRGRLRSTASPSGRQRRRPGPGDPPARRAPAPHADPAACADADLIPVTREEQRHRRAADAIAHHARPTRAAELPERDHNTDRTARPAGAREGLPAWCRSTWCGSATGGGTRRPAAI